MAVKNKAEREALLIALEVAWRVQAMPRPALEASRDAG